jgi:hypothetical protein
MLSAEKLTLAAESRKGAASEEAENHCFEDASLRGCGCSLLRRDVGFYESPAAVKVRLKPIFLHGF